MRAQMLVVVNFGVSGLLEDVPFLLEQVDALF